MQVLKAFPPNYPVIRAAFPHIRGRPMIFAYGGRIYFPTGGKLSQALIDHETVHIQRQGPDPAAWWRRYIDDLAFRFDEEVVAHRAEYRSLSHVGAKAVELDVVARRLSSPLYGASISLERAREIVAA